MKQFIKTIEQTNPKLLFWLIVGTSIVLAAWMQHIQHGWINPDSVLYLEAAKRIVINDFKGAYQIFNWPFYAFCIGTVSKITHLNVHVSAQFLNMIFFAITTASFLNIIRLAGGKNLALFAGALLLFSNTYIVGDVLEMLMRDEGFWASYLTSLVFFIKFDQEGKTKDAILWQGFIILAVLFRIESIVYQLLLPLSFMFARQLSLKQRLINMAKTYSMSLIGFGIIFIAINTVDSLSINNFGRLQEVFNLDLWSIFTQNLVEKSEIMSTQVLGKHLEEYATAGLLITFAYVILVKNLSTLGLVGILSVGAHLKNKLNAINLNVRHVLLAVSIISILNMALIITKVFVLSSRYVVAFTFILLIVAALFLEHLLITSVKKDTKQNTVSAWLLILLMSLLLVKNVLPKRDGYNYSQEAVAWIASNNKNKKPVFYNETRMRYYANEEFIGTWGSNMQFVTDAIDNQSINQYEYLLIASKKKETEALKLITTKIPQYKLVKIFDDTKKRKSILIFKKSEKPSHAS